MFVAAFWMPISKISSIAAHGMFFFLFVYRCFVLTCQIRHCFREVAKWFVDFLVEHKLRLFCEDAIVIVF